MVDRRLFLILLSALLLGPVILTSGSRPPIPLVAAASRSISLVGVIAAWNNTGVANPPINPPIVVTQGDSVTLQLSSGDGVVHRWFVDVDRNGPAPDCPGADVCSNAFTTSTTLMFTANFAPGSYTYYCSVHPTSMQGQFIVDPVAGVGGSLLPVDKLALVAPYIGLASAFALVVAAATVLALRRREKTDD